ncbi:hypothetical protein [Bacillus safensis]|uniref:Uncharacterized protein n=1 Tax=Bacillus safensis TaxID=561879 RepID=A0A1L6ZPD8_BACIA|nr:hypothetical protein [Bacillus safensis]APT48380.1 hypothetical protein BSA145_21190 [Bacillus safensis]
MEILIKGVTHSGDRMQIENWNSTYNSFNYGTTLVVYTKSKVSLEGSYSPKFGRTFRLHLEFKSKEDASQAFEDLKSGKSELTDYKQYVYEKKYKICI